MKCQANRNYKSDDIVMTPESLAIKLVEHFKPSGFGLEPCKGTGNIYKHLPLAEWCEITEGIDFFDWVEHVDYIFTNPPWSQIRKFLLHSYEVADEIYMLFTINHLWTKARLNDMQKAGFGIKEICVFDTPKNFPQSGFQVGMVHLSRGYIGNIKLQELKDE
jgi:hypothetical protein